MKNFKAHLSILVVSFLLFSCSENDGVSTTPEFFNLQIGNEWVYKEYSNSNPNDQTQFVFTGIVDTVKIVGIENIQGLTFAKKSTKKVSVNNGSVLSDTYTYVRVNNSGHLIEISDGDIEMGLSETTGLVLHPGFDTTFSHNQIISYTGNPSEVPDVLGTMEYDVYKSLKITKYDCGRKHLFGKPV